MRLTCSAYRKYISIKASISQHQGKLTAGLGLAALHRLHTNGAGLRSLPLTSDLPSRLAGQVFGKIADPTVGEASRDRTDVRFADLGGMAAACHDAEGHGSNDECLGELHDD